MGRLTGTKASGGLVGFTLRTLKESSTRKASWSLAGGTAWHLGLTHDDEGEL